MLIELSPNCTDCNWYNSDQCQNSNSYMYRWNYSKKLAKCISCAKNSFYKELSNEKI